MKIIIAGIGNVGLTLTQQLCEEHRVIIIDQNPDLVDNLINIYDVMGVCGNGASLDVQTEAEVGKADLLIASMPSDEINILACLLAKKLGIQHTIARIRNPEYEEQLRFMRTDLGLSMAINPEKAAATEIARVLRFPAAIALESFSKGRLELVEYRIPDESPLDGLRLMELGKNFRTRVLICAVTRNKETIIPSGDFQLRTGDKIYLTAAPTQLNQFFRQLGVLRNRVSTVMIIGASKICRYLARELLDMGMSVKIIDRNEARCVQISSQLPKALVITGDGADSDLLHEEGLGQSDAFVAITDIDEANILMGLSVARQEKNCKVVVKINRRSLVDLVSGQGLIDSVVSAASVTAELIVQYVRAMQNATSFKVKTLHRLADNQMEALEFTMEEDAPFLGKPLKDLRIRSGILVVGIVQQNGRIIIPSGMDMIHQNDDVIVVTADKNIRDIRDIFL